MPTPCPGGYPIPWVSAGGGIFPRERPGADPEVVNQPPHPPTRISGPGFSSVSAVLGFWYGCTGWISSVWGVCWGLIWGVGFGCMWYREGLLAKTGRSRSLSGGSSGLDLKSLGDREYRASLKEAREALLVEGPAFKGRSSQGVYRAGGGPCVRRRRSVAALWRGSLPAPPHMGTPVGVP